MSAQIDEAPTMIVELNINEQSCRLEVGLDETLLDALRDAGYKGVKRGCETGACGSCVVLLDGQPHYSCLLIAAAQDGRSVTTIEALDTPEDPHPILTAYAREGGVQCGYCIPGMALTTKALLDQDPDPSEEQARRALDGHLCRCTGYVKQIKAVMRAAKVLRKEVW